MQKSKNITDTTESRQSDKSNKGGKDQKEDKVASTTQLEDSSSDHKKSKSTKEPATMDELIATTGYSFASWKRRDMVEGTIISISPKHILFDIGGKSEAVIHEKEIPFISDLIHELKVGDVVSVQVTNPENDRGQIVVSLRKTAQSKRWQILDEKLKSGEKVEVTLKELSRGGFLVDYAGLRGFVPLSQIDPEIARLGDKATGRRISVKVIEVDANQNRMVFSQVNQAAASEKHKEALKAVKINETYKAEVTGIAPFGAFVSVKIGDVNMPGLIHISEIAWEKVDRPADYLKVGQTVDVKAINADLATGKLTLSLKQLLADPWDDVPKVLSVDQVVHGKVTRVTQYGVFVSVLPGIEGLIHISKLAPGEEPTAGKEIECTIEAVDPEKRKISLSLVSHAKPIGYR